MLKKIIELPKYILHKGYANGCAENTINSIKNAKRYGAKWVELDVNALKDNTQMIFHDDDFNGKKISDYDNYSKFSGQIFFSNGYFYKPPTLQHAMTVCSDLKLGVNLDLKESVYGNENQIINEINKYSVPVLLSSFYPEILYNCLKINKYLNIGILFDKIPYNWKNIANYLNTYSIHANYQHLNDNIIQEITQNNYPLVAYTVNDKSICDSLFSKKIKSIITDNIYDTNSI